MMARGRPKYMRSLMTAQFSTNDWGTIRQAMWVAHVKYTRLKSHQKTLTLNVRETEINTSWIPIRVTIPYNMVHSRRDTPDETL